MMPELGALPDWDSQADDVLVCCQVRQETHDVRTFVFSGREPCLFRFLPGQFLTLELPIGGEIINRCYTISASAARPYRISITVKRQPGGVVSNWLHDNLKPGDEIRALGPMGDFTPAPTSAQKWLMLSGGSGVTPLMSMTRTSFDLAEERDIVFVHAARSPADIIFRHELDVMARQSPRLRLAHICESAAGESHWPALTGRLSLPMLRLIAADTLEREIFCCGPTPFMAGVRAMLGEAGFDMARYHQESFDFAELSPSGSRRSHRGGNRRRIRQFPHRIHPERARHPMRSRHDDPGGGEGGGTAPPILLHARHVRHLQEHHTLRHGRHAARRRHPAAGNRSRPRLALLQQTDIGRRYRSVIFFRSSAHLRRWIGPLRARPGKVESGFQSDRATRKELRAGLPASMLPLQPIPLEP